MQKLKQLTDSLRQFWRGHSPAGGRDFKEIEGKLTQVAARITIYAAEEEAEIKESDVATSEMKSRHHEQPVQPTAAPVDVAT